MDFINPESAEKFVEKGWDEEKQMYYYLVYFNKEEKAKSYSFSITYLKRKTAVAICNCRFLLTFLRYKSFSFQIIN